MWTEFYIWIERYAGVSYDLQSEFSMLTKYLIFVDPYEWKIRIDNIIQHTNDVIDTIDQFGDDIPDYLPDSKSMKRIFTENVVEQLLFVVNNVKRMINLEEVDITNYDILVNQVQTLSDLIKMCLDDFPVKPTTYDTYEEENDDALQTYLGLLKSDLPNLGITVNEIRDEYYALLEEDDE